MELDWVLPSPFTGRKLKESAGRVRWITREQTARLLVESRRDPRAFCLPDFIVLALNTGMRKGEMLGLEWDRVDLQRNLVYLGAGDQKNGQVGSVPINRAARTALLSRARFRATHCPDSPWVFCHETGARVQAIRYGFQGACKRAGITDFHPHDLRHTCAAWLVQAGVSIREVAELLRHSDIRVTMRYCHLSPDHVRSAVEKLDTCHNFRQDMDGDERDEQVRL